MPYGRLRESASNRDRANIIIVTKCPAQIKPIEERIITKELFIRPYQNLYFTRLEYGSARAAFPEDEVSSENNLVNGTSVLLLTGIAYSEPLKEYLMHQSHNILEIKFPDHHNYTLKELDDIVARFNTLPEGRRIICTTEKDMVRIRDVANVPDVIRKNLYYIPLTISFLNGSGKEFDRKIMNYVRDNKSSFGFHSGYSKI